MASKEIEAKIEEQRKILQQERAKEAPESSNKKLESLKEESKKQEKTAKEDTKDELSKEQQSINAANELRVILKGVNDTYFHHFEFKELDLDFDVEIKVPNALEEAPITDFIYGLFPNAINGISNDQYYAYYAMKLLELYGKNLPAILQDPENIYNLGILTAIGEDFLSWKNQFRL